MTREEFEKKIMTGIDLVKDIGKIAIDELPHSRFHKAMIGNIMEHLYFKYPFDYGDTDIGFGFSIEDPIHASCISGNRYYLKLLHETKGNIIATLRFGCYRSPNSDHLIDKYLICYLSKEKEIKFKTIYIDPYCEEMSDKFPNGFE